MAVVTRRVAGLQGVVEDQVYPHVTTGFSDSNAYLRELTLKSMLVLAPKLTQRTLNQSLLKFLAKLQVGLLASCGAALSLVPKGTYQPLQALGVPAWHQQPVLPGLP